MGDLFLVTAADVAAFARSVGETDPVHLDRAAAVAAGWRDVVAPPMFASVYAGTAFRVALDRVPGIRRERTLHAGQEFCWHAVVTAGDALRTTAALASEELHPRLGRFLVLATATTRAGELVTEGRWTVLERA